MVGAQIFTGGLEPQPPAAYGPVTDRQAITQTEEKDDIFGGGDNIIPVLT